MSRFLFISPDHGRATGGREQLSRLHQRVISELVGHRFDRISLPRKPLTGLAAATSVFSGRIDGTNPSAEAKVLEHIAEHNVGQVWLDGSNLGHLAKAVKTRFPKVQLFTFFHNVEPRFFLGALRQRPSLRAAGVLSAAFIAERMATRYSDRLIALNMRDAEGVRHWHGREVTDILPMALEDALGRSEASEPKPFSGQPFLLFVGGSFYANQAGIEWFAREISPHVAIDTFVIGHGMDALRAELERYPRIKVIGPVDDLGPYYHHALAVIAPIFDGSGMKTKVAEAWMHGKAVLGTSEAFTGYDIAAALKPCNDAKGFISAIEAIIDKPPFSFDPALRRAFDNHHSEATLMHSIAQMIDSSSAPR